MAGTNGTPGALNFKLHLKKANAKAKAKAKKKKFSWIMNNVSINRKKNKYK